MKFALIVDKCKVQSYVVRNNKAYELKNDKKPYSFHHSVGNECFIGFWGYPFVFDGCFINWSEWEILPNIDLDLIFVAIESDYQKYKIKDLRKAYPNAIIVSVLKETWNWNQFASDRLKIYNESDFIFTCISEKAYNEYMPELNYCDKPIHFVPQPVNIDFLYDNYYSKSRDELIFSYNVTHNSARIGKTHEFTKYISEKYKIPFINELNPLWSNFLKIWTPSTFHFNLDPSKYFPGQQAMQCAALGVINIGGLNDAHSILWPETATNDFDVLENKFNLYLKDYNKRVEVIQYAFNKLNEVYSYQSVYARVFKILNL